ncbi:MAG: 2-oxoacid:ferredoxin oxidoreductase subunit beta [Rhodospirillales bacterium]|jgi:2-oxoglutarate ferredoxin oxidoreductase subunit beta|nr:2-oxoacid:ferredoxin oxidoreductase subunit beta [Rhodospirillales bacterium]MBT4007240.1 2-oxoacid:ferredoxin oxidoreductase subunit beta [Rhodospirillales bacterium]MBT5076853.1 2-oxoacid:ferredoxin oxidoreductase subunit beta [Rhodospirillales bacterium]MBT5113573.1 2-oxoacid:ferredoxin oxidoreductase subunit beta [Rhodospirillales bacterium]MBT5673871.1 2-oxoacid:ferredoxin oxidoreductase subunit beta [Rhodospirillales bacterium]
MSFIRKPKVSHKGSTRNDLGLTRNEYDGAMSTLCAGCGHDSVTAAMTRAFFELSIPPHRAVKISGIGCSSKTTAYFMGQSHGANTVHGRMPSIATGASAANRELYCIGVSGDGDSLSIGLGQFAHAMRRNLNMLYIIDNNGVYGLTKGQFSASAALGAKAKKGEQNTQAPIDPVKTALALGASFIARSFSGDKAQLVPLIKAGLKHQGFALIDILSPCVTFNDHEDSAMSYAHAYQNLHPAAHADLIDAKSEISASYNEGQSISVTLHDGSTIMLKKTDEDYDPRDRAKAFNYVMSHQERGEIVTGLLYIDENRPDMHGVNGTVAAPLATFPYEDLNPGSKALESLQERYR